MKRILRTSTLTLVVALSVFSSAATPLYSATALSGSDWQAGNIISDSIFTDTNSMSVADIQNFLNKLVPSCDTNGTQPASEYGRPDLTHAQYAALNGWAGPPYVCLRDYYEVPKYSPANYIPANNFSGSIPAGAVSAAQIISDAAKLNNISPKVILVKIATESLGPLTNDTWPMKSQYTYAMGSHCPDSGPNGSANCDQNYAGFSMQVSSGAGLLRYYLDNMQQSWWSYKKPFQTNSILWNVVERNCGAGDVYIGTKATAALYTYTPYQPNQAALNNLYGTGDGCSAYGNRNFWRVFSSMFGSTTVTFESLSDPRYLELTTSAPKINAYTGQPVTDSFTAGLQRRFVDKVSSLNGDQCLRTESDKSLNNPYCFMLKNLGKLNPVYATLTPTDGTMEATADIYKIDMERPGRNMAGPFPATWQRTFVAKTTIDSRTYYVTDVDYANKTFGGFISSSLRPSPIYEKITPVTLDLVNDAPKYAPSTQATISGNFSKGLRRIYTSRTQVNGTWYYRTSTDESNTVSQGFSEKGLHTPLYENFSSPRWMTLNKDTAAYTPSTGQKIGSVATAGTQYKFTSKVYVNDKWYFRAETASASDIDQAFLASDLNEITFEPFSSPRELRLNATAYKAYPIEGRQGDGPFTSGLVRKYNSKVYVNGIWYFRTETDTAHGVQQAFPASALSEL